MLLPLLALGQRYEWLVHPDAPATFNGDKGIAVDEQGYSYIAFTFEGVCLMDGVALPVLGGARDVAVTKVDPDGNILWSRTMGTVSQDAFHDIAVDGTGAVYISMLASAGVNVTADSTYSGTAPYQVIRLGPDGSFRGAASFPSYVNIDAIRNEVYMSFGTTVQRTDTAFSVVWSYDSGGNPAFIEGLDMFGAVSARGGRVAFSGFDATITSPTLAGLTLAGNGVADDQSVVFVLDTAGVPLWGFLSDGTNNVLEEVRDVGLDDAGGLFLGIQVNYPTFQFAGATVVNSNANPNLCVLARIDPMGMEQWATRFEPTTLGGVDALAVTASGNAAFMGPAVIGGSIGTFALGPGERFYVAMVDAAGTPLWLKSGPGFAPGGSDLDGGPGEDVWAALFTNNNLSFDCVTLQGFSYIIGTRISDQPAMTPDAGFSFTSNMLTVDFTDLSIDADSWLWDFGDGGTSTDPDPSHTYAVPGTYTVTLSASAGTCSDVFSAQVVVLTTGVPETRAAGLFLYPNPATDRLNLDRPVRTTDAIRILDMQGRVLAGWSQEGSDRVDVRALPAGMYQMEVQQAGGLMVGRFVKE